MYGLSLAALCPDPVVDPHPCVLRTAVQTHQTGTGIRKALRLVRPETGRSPLRSRRR
ncbi:MAG: hypothetical protein MZU91_02045 [Desulfosudis oleivorans]|nr:hypothetical protein [Desulfosudis oleivorans]